MTSTNVITVCQHPLGEGLYVPGADPEHCLCTTSRECKPAPRVYVALDAVVAALLNADANVPAYFQAGRAAAEFLEREFGGEG